MARATAHIQTRSRDRSQRIEQADLSVGRRIIPSASTGSPPARSAGVASCIDYIDFAQLADEIEYWGFSGR
jgi:hypothetical protein